MASRLLLPALAVVAATAIGACSSDQPTTQTAAAAPLAAAPSTTPAPLPESIASPPTAQTTTTPSATTRAPRPAATTTNAKTVYRCEPNAAAKFDDPSRPNTITNKNCPGLNAAKEKAQREYAEQQATERAAVSEAALKACREQTGQTTQQCKAQAARGEAS